MKSCLFTVSFAGFWGQDRLDLEQSIAKTAELGYEGVEIMGKRPHLSVLDYSLEDCQRIGDLIEKHQLKVAAVAGYNNFTGGMDSPEVPFVEMQVDYVDQLAQRAALLGGDLVRIFSSYERDDVPFARQWQVTIDAIRQCADRAAIHGVKIGIQNHHDIGVDTRALEQLLVEVDRSNVVAMFDCWSIHLRGADLAADVNRMASKIGFTTVADYVTIPRYRYDQQMVNYLAHDPAFVRAVPMGEGELDYTTFFAALKQVGYDGWVCYEMCSPVRDGGDMATLERYARTFLEYMKG